MLRNSSANEGLAVNCLFIKSWKKIFFLHELFSLTYCLLKKTCLRYILNMIKLFFSIFGVYSFDGESKKIFPEMKKNVAQYVQS
ncbi:MAG: hypothetical protein BGO14_10590 [Chlamydiales bacterium 38-26]|nr:MAG: hypothetical protein BGO14_10590 [Chlamydiales bacterium 38-26]